MKRSFVILSAATCVWFLSARNAQAADFWDCVSATGYCTETCSYSDTQEACNTITNTTSGGTSLWVTATAGVGIWGSDTSSGIGVQGTSVSGVGLYGFYGSDTIAEAPYGPAGVVGYGDQSGGTGVFGKSFGDNGYGVWGYATESGSVGVYGQTDDGFGIEGIASNTGSGGEFLAEGTGYGIWAKSVSGLSAFINGSGQYTGTWTVSSDERLKKEIAPETAGLDQLLRLRPVTFKWKEPSEHGGEAGIQHGFIAQDVQKVFPEWVHKGADDYLSLDKTQIDGLEIEALRTLKTENDALKERVRTLENGGHPVVGAMGNFGGVGTGNLALSLLTLVGAYAISRRKKAEA